MVPIPGYSPLTSHTRLELTSMRWTALQRWTIHEYNASLVSAWTCPFTPISCAM